MLLFLCYQLLHYYLLSLRRTLVRSVILFSYDFTQRRQDSKAQSCFATLLLCSFAPLRLCSFASLLLCVKFFTPQPGFPFNNSSKYFSSPTCPPLKFTSSPFIFSFFEYALHNGAPITKGASISTASISIALAA